MSSSVVSLSTAGRILWKADRDRFLDRLSTLQSDFSHLELDVRIPESHPYDGCINLVLWAPAQVRRYGLLVADFSDADLEVVWQALTYHVLVDTSYKIEALERSATCFRWTFRPNPDYYVLPKYIMTETES